MKRVLKIDSAEHEIEILSPAPSCRFRIDGSGEREAIVAVPEPGVYSILLDGRVFEVRVEPGPSALEASVDGKRFVVEVRNPRAWSRNAHSGGADGVQTICSPMPGKVIRRLTSVGDEVAAGQGMIVVEAMKMQNEIKAPRAGRVLAINAHEGSTVLAGEVLATIE